MVGKSHLGLHGTVKALLQTALRGRLTILHPRHRHPAMLTLVAKAIPESRDNDRPPSSSQSGHSVGLLPHLHVTIGPASLSACFDVTIARCDAMKMHASCELCISSTRDRIFCTYAYVPSHTGATKK